MARQAASEKNLSHAQFERIDAQDAQRRIVASYTASPSQAVARPVSEWAKRIADRGDDDGLWLMNPDGGDRHLVHLPADTGSISYDTRFVWSPDGSRIAFVNGSDLLLAGFSPL